MTVPKRVEFPEITSTQINVAMIADKVNELIRYLEGVQGLPRAAVLEVADQKVPEKAPLPPTCPHPDHRVLSNGKWLCTSCMKFIPKK